jgi:hypothetical protein
VEFQLWRSYTYARSYTHYNADADRSAANSDCYCNADGSNANRRTHHVTAALG